MIPILEFYKSLQGARHRRAGPTKPRDDTGNDLYHSQIEVELIFVEGFSVAANVTQGKGGDGTGLDKGRDGQVGMWHSSMSPTAIALLAIKLCQVPEKACAYKPLSTSSPPVIPGP